MKIISFFGIYVVFSLSCIAQPYIINHFQSEYDTITNYKSASVEMALSGTDQFYGWEKRFDLGFEFPFFGKKYSQVIMDSGGVGYFPESPEYNIYLFAGDYCMEVIDSFYNYSEVRYKTTVVNSLKALVVEYHNVYFFDEYFENGYNHLINFQMWFYENGTIELHFGKIDLENCSYYFPGLGFSFDNQNPIGEIFGPWVGIQNEDESYGAFFSGDHQNPDLVYGTLEDSVNVLTSIPPIGYVVQFRPSGVSKIDNLNDENIFHTVQENGKIEIKGKMSDYKSCSIYDLRGRKIGFTSDRHFKINSVSPQVLILIIDSKYGNEIHKIVYMYSK